jgi:hypothetical protein
MYGMMFPHSKQLANHSSRVIKQHRKIQGIIPVLIVYRGQGIFPIWATIFEVGHVLIPADMGRHLSLRPLPIKMQ